MSLELKSSPLTPVSRTRSAAPIRVTHEERAAVVVVAEMEGATAQDWEASRNRAFWNELQESGIAGNAVVMVSPAALPKLSNGSIDATAVSETFAQRRGYVREELLAWVINRLCQILYFAPLEFDPSLDWARYGVDSAVALELLADLEDQLEVRLPQALAECRNPGELVTEATAHLLSGGKRLPWWRSPWVKTESL